MKSLLIILFVLTLIGIFAPRTFPIINHFLLAEGSQTLFVLSDQMRYKLILYQALISSAFISVLYFYRAKLIGIIRVLSFTYALLLFAYISVLYFSPTAGDRWRTKASIFKLRLLDEAIRKSHSITGKLPNTLDGINIADKESISETPGLYYDLFGHKIVYEVDNDQRGYILKSTGIPKKWCSEFLPDCQIHSRVEL